MKKFFTAMVLLLTAAITLTFSGCEACTMENFLTNEDPSQELVDRWCRDGDDCVYSGKVSVFKSSDETHKSRLEVIKGSGENTSWEVILEDDFEKVAWYDYKLFILVDRTYYMFDIKAYEPPEYTHDEPVYELKEYNIFHMRELYPDFESFDWY